MEDESVRRSNPSTRRARSPMQSWEKIDYLNGSIYVYSVLLNVVAKSLWWQILNAPRRCFDLARSLRAAVFTHARRLLKTQYLVPEVRNDLQAVPMYEYKPLKTRQIRLIEVYNGFPGGHDPPSIDLITTSLDSPRPYMALSYTWGDSKTKKSILCSGERLDITSNLYDALRYCRKEDSVSYIWADAICIDQSNENEQNNQIPLMGDIYWHSQRTQRVVIWLGEEKSTTRAAIKTIRDLLIQLRSDEGNWQSSNTFVRPEDFYADIAILRATDWYPLEVFLDNPWFLRKWIIQEAVLGINPLMICGSQTLNWHELARFAYRFLKSPFPRLNLSFLSPKSNMILKQIQWMADISHPDVWERILHDFSLNIPVSESPIVDSSMNPVAENIERSLQEQKHPFQKWWKRYHGDSSSTASDADPTLRLFEFQKKRRLLQLLPTSVNFECERRHDHLYALLGMASDVGETSPIVVEYRSPSVDLGSQLVDWCLTQSKDWIPWQSNHEDREADGHTPTLDFLSLIESSDERKLDEYENALHGDDCATTAARRRTTLPSWIPDIAARKTARKLQVSPLIYSFQFPIHASGWPLLHPKPERSACGKILRLRGQHVDEINSMSTALVMEQLAGHGSGLRWKWILHHVGAPLRILIGFGILAYSSKVLWQVARMTKEYCEIALQGEDEFSEERLEEFYEAMVFESSYQGHSIVERSTEQQRKTIKAFEELMNYYLNFGFMVLLFKFPVDAIRLVGPDIASRGNNRRFCATANRRLGWVPRNAKVGDIIVIFYGAKVPYVIRPREVGKDEGYTFIGECYIRGLMQGDAFESNIDDPVFELK